MGKNVVILLPEGWYIEECCVKNDSPSTAPTAALVLAAYLRKLGHNPEVLVHKLSGAQKLKISRQPDAFIVYAPWFQFHSVSQTMIKIFRQFFPKAISILIMYESLADFEIAALQECPEIDYAVLPHEKELAVADILNHGERTCPGGFGRRSGIVYRNQDNQPVHDGKRPACSDLSHLPYYGDELIAFLKQNDQLTYDNAGILLQRGCPKLCTFCPIRTTRARYRDPDIAADEMALVADIFGNDKVGTLSHEAFHRKADLEILTDKLIERNLNITWSLGARCDLVDDPDLLKKLKRAGVRQLYFGIEAATDEGRRLLKKPIEEEDIRRAISLTAEVGLDFTAAFIAGFPWEDAAYLDYMAKYIREIAAHEHCQRVAFSRLIPYPSLPVEKELVEQKILPAPSSFSDWNQNRNSGVTSVKHTRHLNPEQLDSKIKQIAAEVRVLNAGRKESSLSHA